MLHLWSVESMEICVLLLWYGMRVEKRRIALIILRHFDYIKIVVDLICINDKLIFTYSELF